MKHAFFSLLVVVGLALLAGCVHQVGRRPWACMGGSCAQAPENCQDCSDQGGDASYRDPGRIARFLFGRECCCRRCREPYASEPAAATITYPYYTVRGPRDFLAKNPPSIGP